MIPDDRDGKVPAAAYVIAAAGVVVVSFALGYILAAIASTVAALLR